MFLVKNNVQKHNDIGLRNPFPPRTEYLRLDAIFT